MRFLAVHVLSLASLLIVGSPATARTWNISEDGTGDAPTIQAGIDSAAVGDTVLVGPGTYFEEIDFLGKNIVVKSQLGPAVTMLDGSREESSVVIFQREETRAAVLEGFTITNGRGATGDPRGGGIWCPTGSPVIRGNVIVNNEAKWGGGMAAGRPNNEPGPLSNPLIEENTFENNLTDGGGAGLFIQSCKAIIRRNIFRANREMGGDGGGIRIDLRLPDTRVEVLENQFWRNVAGDQGGGVYVGLNPRHNPGPVVIEGNLIVHNVAQGGPGELITGTGGGIGVDGMTGTIRYNTVVNNTGEPVGQCTGGGLRLISTGSDLEVSNNIIAFNEGCGVACRSGGIADMGQNLLWANKGEDLQTSECPSEWIDFMVFEDPLFCDPENGDYTVAINSPALTGPEPMGAFAEPGCEVVRVQPTSWGRIKARYE
jgi:hypothetical protein